MSDPFSQITSALTSPRGPWLPTPQPEPAQPSKTDRLREYLRTQGSATAIDLALEADLASTGLVGALLKVDLERGRVEFRAGRYTYNHEFDEAMDAEIRKAMALLKRHGYKVKKP